MESTNLIQKVSISEVDTPLEDSLTHEDQKLSAIIESTLPTQCIQSSYNLTDKESFSFNTDIRIKEELEDDGDSNEASNFIEYVDASEAIIDCEVMEDGIIEGCLETTVDVMKEEFYAMDEDYCSHCGTVMDTGKSNCTFCGAEIIDKEQKVVAGQDNEIEEDNDVKNDLISANTVYHVKSELKKLTIKREVVVGVNDLQYEDAVISSDQYLQGPITVISKDAITDESPGKRSLEYRTDERRRRKSKALTRIWCSHCSYTCSSMSMMTRHIRRHTGERPHQCPECNYRASTQNSINKHMMIHKGLKPFSCRNCSYKCRFKSVLDKHVKTCGLVAWQCTVCNFETYSRADLREHRKTHFRRRNSFCYLCRLEFNKFSLLLKHFKEVHTDTWGLYMCPQCDLRFLHKGQLRLHFKTHQSGRNYECKLCPYSTSEKSELKLHSTTHAEEKPFQCDLCNYKCLLKSALKVHMKTHSQEKPYKCKECTYASKYEGAYKRHVLHVHSDEKIPCLHCDYIAKNDRAMTKHLTKHVNFDYKCHLCSFLTVDLKHLHLHIAKTHTAEIIESCNKPTEQVT